jgi:hypothetical protein
LHDYEYGYAYTVKLTQDELLLSEFEGNHDEEKCYLPFVSQNQFSDLNIFGNVVMKKYYTVFDASYSNLYNRVGIGLKNPIDQIGLDMINDGKNELLEYQFMVAGVLLLSAIFLFIVVYCYCKSKKDDFSE